MARVCDVNKSYDLPDDITITFKNPIIKASVVHATHTIDEEDFVIASVLVKPYDNGIDINFNRDDDEYTQNVKFAKVELALSEYALLERCGNLMKEEDFDKYFDRLVFNRAAFLAATRVNTRLRQMGFTGTFIVRYPGTHHAFIFEDSF